VSNNDFTFIDMNVADYIRVKIERLPKGYVFTYSDLITDVNKRKLL